LAATWYVTPKFTNGLRKRRLALCDACCTFMVRSDGAWVRRPGPLGLGMNAVRID